MNELKISVIICLIYFNSIIILAQLISLSMCQYYKPKYPIIELYFKSNCLSFFIWIFNLIGLIIIYFNE